MTDLNETLTEMRALADRAEANEAITGNVYDRSLVQILEGKENTRAELVPELVKALRHAVAMIETCRQQRNSYHANCEIAEMTDIEKDDAELASVAPTDRLALKNALTKGDGDE